MKLDLSEIAGTTGMEATREVDERCPEELGLECTSPVKGRIHISNTGSLLLIEGEVSTEVKLQCSRCLIDFTSPVEARIEEEFPLVRIGDMVNVLPIDEEESSADLVSGNILDVQELVRHNLLVAMSIQPLCTPDCKGLCPTCGENLNVRKCSCLPVKQESPFQVLADLFEEKSSGS